MYEVDELDEVIELKSIPRSDVGAPVPAVIATEQKTSLIYYLSDVDENWDGSYVDVVSASSSNEPVAVITFRFCYAHMFGPPNDEAFEGHPLASRGLNPYRVFEIKNSSWLRALEKMNSVHPCHRSKHFAKYNHYIFAFHDSTFECIAEEFEISIVQGSIVSGLSSVLKNIE